MKTNSFSVFLINKDKVENYSELVVDECRESKIAIDEGTLFYRIKKDDNYPAWVDGFFGGTVLGNNKKMFKSKTVAAVYFTCIDWKGKTVIFAVAFGTGRYLIKQEFIKREFGLDTSRHAIDASRISSMSTITYDSGIKSKTIQSVTEIAQNDFFLNPNTDVLSAVKGKTRATLDSDLLKDRMIGGRDSVSMAAKVDVSNIKEFLRALYSEYKSNAQQGVRYESNIEKLTKEGEIRNAECLLESRLQSDHRSECVFFNLPLEEIKEDIMVSGYILDGDREIPSLTDEIFNNIKTVKQLKQKNVTVRFKDEGKPDLIKRLYQFVYAEIEDSDNLYILAGAQFYKVARRYKVLVEKYYEDAKKCTIQNLKAWNGEKEEDFNRHQTGENILVMDKKFVHPERTDKFEFCDLLTSKKQIVHTKIFKGASQPLGHLFNQGLVSARCMQDEEIRRKINNIIKKKQKKLGKARDFTIPQNAKLGDYKVTFLILCNDNTRIDDKGKPRIPFLAKAVFRENATAIRSMGYKVAIVGKVRK